MLNKFLAGKKKYSVFIITALTLIIQTFVSDPESTNQLMELVPTLAMVLSGIVYLLVEGFVDVQRAKQPTPATASSIIATGSTSDNAPITINGSGNPQISEPERYEPFDPAAFDKQLDDKAKATYLEANDITRFFAAQDLGWQTKCQHIDQALAYWDHLVGKANKAFQAKFGYPYAEADKHLGDDKSCPYYSVDNMARQKGIDFWRMLLDLRKVIKQADELSQVAAGNINWKAKLASQHQTLHGLGGLAGELLSHG